MSWKIRFANGNPLAASLAARLEVVVPHRRQMWGEQRGEEGDISNLRSATEAAGTRQVVAVAVPDGSAASIGGMIWPGQQELGLPDPPSVAADLEGEVR